MTVRQDRRVILRERDQTGSKLGVMRNWEYDRGRFPQRWRATMASVTLSATPSGNGYQATVSYDGWVSMSSAETYATIAEAITAAAIKMLDMPERLEAMDREAQTA